MATPDTRHSIVVKKKFTYRDGDKTWTSRHHFTNTALPTTAEWIALSDAIVTSEKACYDPSTTIVETIGYDASTATSTNPHGDAVFTKTYTTAGTLSPTSTSRECPGDCAGIIRWATDARTSKNHPIYLFSYFHDVYSKVSDQDKMDTVQLGNANTYATAWVTGFSDGVNVRQRCGPRGAVALSGNAKDLITHRDLRR